MPNIFPPIQLQQQSPTAMVTPNDQVAAPSVLGSVSSPSAGSVALTGAQNQLQADTPQKYDYSSHGVLGNIGHVLERFGNIAGDVLDPGATSLIPGSDLFKMRQLHQDHALLQQAQENKEAEQRESDSVNNESSNREQKQSEFDAEAPGRAADVREKNAQAELAEGGKYQVIPTPQGYIRVNPASGDAQHLTVDGKPVGAPVKSEHVQLEIGGKPHTVLVDSTTGNVIHDLGPTGEKPPTVNVNAGAETVNVPDGQGGYTVQRARPGDHIAPGALSASGMSSMNAPTSQQRNAAGRAQQVLDSIPDVLNDLHTNAAQLGPGMGRFNDIYSGKVGAPNPEFAGLVSDLKLLGTSVAIAHAQGRMSNELLNEFNSMIAEPHQDPKNIEAVIGKVQKFMQRSAQQGKAVGSQGESGAPPAGAKIRDYSTLGSK